LVVWCTSTNCIELISLHSITANVSPLGRSGGIELLLTDTFRLECFQTPTGIKFYVTAERNQQHLEQTLRSIYEIYSDYVLKNPFYMLEQPIRCERFQAALQALISQRRD
jgi:trafficking protein particle complex subunit 4